MVDWGGRKMIGWFKCGSICMRYVVGEFCLFFKNWYFIGMVEGEFCLFYF